MDAQGDCEHKTINLLDVEDEDARRNRIGCLLENLNSSSLKPFSSLPPGVPEFCFGVRETYHVQPPTELISRVQAFLPQLEASNTLLAQRKKENPTSVDIEHISEGVDQYIEMNLGLGLFEDHSRGKNKCDEDSEMTSSSDDLETVDGLSDDDESDVEIMTSFVPIRPIKPLPRRVTNPRPNIVVISEEKVLS